MTTNDNPYYYNSELEYVANDLCNVRDLLIDEGHRLLTQFFSQGGYQSYCCRGFRPPKQLKRDPELLDPEDLDSDPTSLAKRDLRSCAFQGAFSGGGMLALTGAAGLLGALASHMGGQIVTVYCRLSESEASYKKIVGYSGPVTRNRAALALAAVAAQRLLTPQKTNKGKPPKNPTGGVMMYGR
jgi:hypothetical protein